MQGRWTRVEYRSVLVRPDSDLVVNGEIPKLHQAFHTVPERAAAWAKEMLAVAPAGSTVEVYKQSEVLVEVHRL